MVTAALGILKKQGIMKLLFLGSASNGLFDVDCNPKNGVTACAADIETNNQGQLLRASVHPILVLGPVA